MQMELSIAADCGVMIGTRHKERSYTFIYIGFTIDDEGCLLDIA
jgi:hypothetical protein